MTAPHSGGSFGHNEEREEHLIDPIDGEDAEGNPTVESSGESSSSSGEDEEGNPVAKSNDGSSPSDDEETEEHLIDPIDEDEIRTSLIDTMKSLNTADRKIIRDLLNEFLRHPKDVETMSQILSKEVSDSSCEDNDTVDGLFILTGIAQSILEFVGVQTEKGRILYKMEVTQKFNAVALMIEDILKLELKEGDLIKIFPSM